MYIHNERSIQSNIFCTQILCASSINEFLLENCIVWGFDVTNLNNKQLIYSQVERMFGGRVASGLKRMNDDEYPVIIVSHGKVLSTMIFIIRAKVRENAKDLWFRLKLKPSLGTYVSLSEV